MISREQLAELKALGKQIRYNVVKDGARIRADGKCSTFSALNDQEGYLSIKETLEGIISKSQPRVEQH